MPLRETAYQGYTFLALAYAGAASAAFFDLLRPLLDHGFWLLRLLGDALFSAVLSLLSLAALALTGCGGLRLYMPLALAAGAAIYRLGIRRVLLRFINLFRRNRSSGKESE